MKTYICLFVFLVISYANAEGMQSCISDENCAEGECCISMAFIRGFCHNFGDVGDHCIMEPAITKFGKKNIFGCPCKEGLKCVPEVIEEGDGKTTMKNFSCKTVTG